MSSPSWEEGSVQIAARKSSGGLVRVGGGWYVLLMFVTSNLPLVCLGHVIPGHPLDGGRVLRVIRRSLTARFVCSQASENVSRYLSDVSRCLSDVSQMFLGDSVIR